MTYAKGSNIAATDYNAFAGVTGTAAASSVAAQNKAGYLYGIGFGDRGYGQSSPTLITKNVGDAVGQEWQDLRSVVASLASWTNTPITLLPPTTSLNNGVAVTAHEQDAPSSNAYDFQNLIASLDANRFNYQIGNMTLTNSAASTTRSTTWGGGTGGITAEFSVTFASEDAARYFFNTGGEIRLALAHPSTLTSRDTSWNTILSNLVLAFRANAASKITGAYGTAQAIGYYQLTTAYQTILNGTNSSIGAYTVNDFTISARAVSITGLNGAKGSVVYFRVQLVDEQTNAFSDIVQSGTIATLSHLRATSTYSLPSPTSSIVTSF